MHHIKYFALSPFMQTYTQYFTASVQQRTGFHTTFSKYLLSYNHLKKIRWFLDYIPGICGFFFFLLLIQTIAPSLF